jgi:hypothetical protein
MTPTTPTPASHPHMLRFGGLLVAAAVSATGLVPVGTASADWRTSSSTLVEFRDVCRDGIRFGGAVRDLAGPANAPYKNRAVAVQPPPKSWAEWNGDGEVLNTLIEIPERKTTVETEDEGAVEISHEGGFTKRYRDRALLPLGPLALNLENGNPESNLNIADVTDCFLYAPIDVEPGKSANKVPIGRGHVSVAVLATNVLRAEGLTPGNFLFGPGRAKATSSRLRDVNGDNRRDLVLRFRSTDAGLTCSTGTAVLLGKTATNGTYEGSDKIRPNC